MAEYVTAGIVTVPAGQNVPMVSTAACGKPCIVHRACHPAWTDAAVQGAL